MVLSFTIIATAELCMCTQQTYRKVTIVVINESSHILINITIIFLVFRRNPILITVAIFF